MSNNLGNKKTMAKNIRYYMELNGVTSKELCKILDVPTSTFSYWLNARTYPRIDKIEKMANYFHITKPDLIEERDTLIQNSNLTEEEEHLIQNYRNLNSEGQEKLVGYSEDLLSSGRYQKGLNILTG